MRSHCNKNTSVTACGTDTLGLSLMPRPKNINAFIERKLETAWTHSRDRGWSVGDFASLVIEVLVILNHREKVREAVAAGKKQPLIE